MANVREPPDECERLDWRLLHNSPVTSLLQPGDPRLTRSEPYLLFVVALFAATVLTTIACVIVGRSRLESKQRALAKVCRALGIAVVVVGSLGTASGIILTVAATAAPGLTESDRTRMWSNGLVEASYNVLLALAVATPALLIARRSLRPRKVSG